MGNRPYSCAIVGWDVTNIKIPDIHKSSTEYWEKFVSDKKYKMDFDAKLEYITMGTCTTKYEFIGVCGSMTEDYSIIAIDLLKIAKAQFELQYMTIQNFPSWLKEQLNKQTIQLWHGVYYG